MRVILAAGGSGGHIFPSIALASELEKAGIKDIFFVSSKRRLDRTIFKDSEHPCFFLSVNPMPLSFNIYRMLMFLFKSIMDIIKSIYIVFRLKPDIVVGFGGYSSGSIAVAAKIFKVPLLIHEQNFFPGRANKILSRIADCVAVSFKESAVYFSNISEKTVYSGNPLRLDRLSNNRVEAARRFSLSPEKKTILAMGGSQGCSFLNDTVSKAAHIINGKVQGAVQFIHLTGRKDYTKIKQFYAENKIPGEVFSFLESIADAYAVSDLAITRSGAAAIFELAFYSKPMILVPYPSAKNSQRSNAMYFSQAGAAVYKEEGTFSADDLAEEVLGILLADHRLHGLSQAAGRLSVPEAGERLAKEVVLLGARGGRQESGGQGARV